MSKNPLISLQNLKRWLDEGRFDAVVQVAHQILADTPFEPNAHHALGIVLMQQGSHLQALKHLQQASSQLAHMPDVWLNLGSAYRHTGNLSAARSAYERALALEPKYLAALLNSASVALLREDYYEAEIYAVRSLEVDPGNQAGLQNLARALSCTGRYDQAASALIAAWPRAKHHKKAVSRDIVSMLLRLDKVDDAEAFIQRCLRDGGSESEYLALSAEVAAANGNAEKSLALYRKAFELKKSQPTPEAKFSFACQLLIGGNLTEGWKLHRDRYRMAQLRKGEWKLPIRRLEGGQFAGRKMLLLAEQGIADEIWYASLLPEILAATPDAVIAVSPRLRTLFQRSFPQHLVIDKSIDQQPVLGDKVVDWYAPYADAAEWLRPTLDDFKKQPAAYLNADPALANQWRSKLGALSNSKPVVGISWRSTRDKKDAVGFTYPDLKSVAALMRRFDVRWINLQYDDPDGVEAQKLALLAGVPLITLPDLDLKDDFEGQAAAMSVMAAVIGPSNAPVVLASSLGVPTVSFWARSLRIFWRTHGQTDATPWLPTMRLAHRKSHESWEATMDKAADLLTAALHQGSE